MPVSPLLASMANMPEIDSTPALAQIWMLAESTGDAEVMETIASRSSALPPAVVERLRLRKEPGVRIAYLSRPDLTDDERTTLLAEEKRSEVFAGLLAAAKANESLAARLTEQFTARPTKVLARQMLRDGFGNAALRFECLKVLISEKRPPDWMTRNFRGIVKENLKDTARTSVLADILPVDLLTDLDMASLEPAAQLQVIERMVAFADRERNAMDWDARRTVTNICKFLVASAALPGLTDEVVTALDAVASAEWMEDGDRIAGALAGRRAMMEDSVDEQRLMARTVTGARLNDLVELALAGSNSVGDAVVQGLLENPAVWTHKEFESLVHRANAALIVKAMQTVRNHDFFAKLWLLSARLVPESCWDHVDDAVALRERLIVETLAADHRHYAVESSICDLLDRGVSDEAVGQLPFALIMNSRYHRRYAPPVLQAVAAQVMRLQLTKLGEHPQRWENFNNLSTDWSGSLSDLLDASMNL